MADETITQQEPPDISWTQVQARDLIRPAPTQSELAQIASSITDEGKKLETGHYDADGRMIVYYSIGASDLSPEQAATATAQLHAHDVQMLKKTEERFDSSLEVEPEVADSFAWAAAQYENIIPVRFVPLREAPPGTEPTIILVSKDNPGPYETMPTIGKSNFPEDPYPFIWTERNRFTFSSEAARYTMLHEIGHRFNLKHPNNNPHNNPTQTVMDYETQATVWVDAVPQRLSFDTNVNALAPADVLALQSIYGVAVGTLPAAPIAEPYLEIRDTPEEELILDTSHADPMGLLINANGVMRNGVMDVQISNADSIMTWQGTAGMDFFTSSISRGNVMIGGGETDDYTVLATDNDEAHTIIDQGANSVTVAPGAQVTIQPADGKPFSEQDITLTADFSIGSTHVTRDGEQVTITLHPNAGGAPSVITMPLKATPGEEMHLRLTDHRYEPLEVTVPALPTASPDRQR